MKKHSYFVLAAVLLMSSGCLRRGVRPPAPPEVTESSEIFQRPLAGTLTILSRFGPRGGRYHTGLDMRGRKGGGDAVLASRAGRVILVGRLSGYGNIIAIKHVDGFISRYAHLKSFSVNKGQSVQAKEQIGIVGRTGRATTEHLHFEILTPKNRFLDPYPYLFARLKRDSVRS